LSIIQVNLHSSYFSCQKNITQQYFIPTSIATHFYQKNLKINRKQKIHPRKYTLEKTINKKNATRKTKKNTKNTTQKATFLNLEGQIFHGQKSIRREPTFYIYSKI